MSSAPSSNLALSEEQILLAENLHRFLRNNNSLEQRKERLAKPVPDRVALWPGLIDLGLAGAAFPESAGGFGDDARTVAIVMFELGRSLAIEPYLGCAVVAGRVLLRISDKPLRNDLINRILSGELITVLAHESGVDPFGWPKPYARKESYGFSVSGRIKCVRHSDVSGEFLVTAMLESSPAVFRVPRTALNIQSYSLMDGTCAADLVFADLHLDPEALLSFDVPVHQVVAEALEWGIFGVAAETLGIINAANCATFHHLVTRKQFGATLATFQALQHRAADMWIAEHELFALITAAVPAMTPEAGVARSSVLSALKCLADKSGRRVGHEAIQLHGGMGVSDELAISHFARRLAAIRSELGSQILHATRFDCAQDLNGLLRLQESPEDRDWREQVAAFTERYLPPLIAAKGRLGLKIEKDDYLDWQKVLYEHGLFAGAWPREHGGQGWDLIKQLLFTQETALHDAPWISPYGVNMVGPVLYTFGSESQKRQHLPGILSNSVWWCQGYSEPGAGSDLASLKTTAELAGDHYVVNGAKLWTTEAHWADWMHCLVRTGKTGKPQSGITFLLIDMTLPGISVKPIITIDGMHHTNSVFLDDVRVPVSNRVGEEGEGWHIAKFLLSNERVSIGDTGQKLRLLRHVQTRYRSVIAENELSDDMKALLTHRLSEVSMQMLTLCAMERQFINAWASGKRFGVEASIIKIRSTEILQAMTELALELEGSLAAAYDPQDLLRPPNLERNAAQRASSVGYEYLYGRCWTIFGGTNEIQRNIIAKGILSPMPVS